MPRTTVATSLSLIKDTTLAMLIEKFFVQPDPAIARVPMLWAPPGYQWVQEYVSSETAATAFSHFDTFAATAFTVSEYTAYLSGLAKMDQRNRAMSALGEGPNQGRQDRLTKKKMIIKALAELWREYVYTGEPVTVAVGGNLAAVIGANATIELGPRKVTFTDVHQFAGATSTTEGLIRWNLAAQTLEYQAPGDTQYGPPVVVTAANNFRLTLWSGGGVAASKNEPKWIRVSIADTELAALLVSGNFTPTAGVAADVLTYTPTKQMTGFYRQITPMQQCYHDLSGTPPASGISVGTNGPPAGGSLNRENLTWMKQRLLDASNEQPSQCAIFMSDNLMNRAEGLITSLGHGSETVRFLGSDLHTLQYQGIPILRNQWLPTNLTSRDGTRTDLTLAMGVCFGESDDGGAHVKYRTMPGDVVNEVLADGSFDMTRAVGDGTPQGTMVPVSYWETPYSSTQLDVNQIGHMMGEPVAHIQDLCAVTHLFNG
jgi:hypothetical protein